MFSVIIPAHNAAPYIKNSIESVLAQSINDFEIIVVDDGSTDETKSVVLSLADARIRYIYQENGGVSSARNTGIKNAKGEYVCFLDADDIWKDCHLEVVSNLIDRFPACNVYLTGYEIRLQNGDVINKRFSDNIEEKQSDNVFKDIWECGYFIHTNSVVCRTNVFDTVGLFEMGIKNGEDDDMWYRLFLYYSVAISSKITTVYIRENSRATVSKVFVDDWIFLRRVDKFMSSSDITSDRKEFLKRLLEQRKLSYIRNRIVAGDKKTAFRMMLQLNIPLLKTRKLLETILAFCIPSFVLRKALQKRDKNYYSE